MAVFDAADAPLRARQVCEAMDLEITPNNLNNTRLKLEWFAERGIWPRTSRARSPSRSRSRSRNRPATSRSARTPSRKCETDIN
jgi:hypothetical protein